MSGEPGVFARALAIKKKALRKSQRAGVDARTTAGQETGATVLLRAGRKLRWGIKEQRYDWRV